MPDIDLSCCALDDGHDGDCGCPGCTGQCYCGGCIGMGPCDDELGTRGDECGECALEAQHDGPCAWLCSHCGGSGRCPDCRGTGGYDDVQRCSECDAGDCPYCTDGLVSDDDY